MTTKGARGATTKTVLLADARIAAYSALAEVVADARVTEPAAFSARWDKLGRRLHADNPTVFVEVLDWLRTALAEPAAAKARP